MSDIDFSDLPNPKLDLDMGGMGDTSDTDVSPTDNVDVDDYVENIKGNVGGDQEEDEDINDGLDSDEGNYPYDPKSFKDALADAAALCDKEGVPYTQPMENQLKAGAKSGILTYNNIWWYIKGIATANQTQILPAVSSAAGEIKMEVRHLQNAANKVNKESARVEKLTSSLMAELHATSDAITNSFRQAMKTVLDEVHAMNQVVAHDKPRPVETAADRIKREDLKIHERPATLPDKVDQLVETKKETADEVMHKEKRAQLKVMGFAPKLIGTMTDATIDDIYPDQLYSLMSKSPTSIKVKTAVKSAITGNITRMLEDSDSEDEESEDDSEDGESDEEEGEGDE